MAIDPSGNFVIVNQPTPFRIENRESATLYLILQFREVLTGPTQLGIEGVGPPTRIAEVYQIQVQGQAAQASAQIAAFTDGQVSGNGAAHASGNGAGIRSVQ